MSSRFRSLRRLRHSPLFIAAVVLVLTSGAIVGGTFASFTGETQNKTSTLALGWLGAPSGLGMTASGSDGSLTWTPGTHGLDGQTLTWEDNGTSSSCPTAISSNSTAMASTSTASYTQANAENTTITDAVGSTTLNANISNSATSLTIAAGTAGNFPASNGFTIQIGSEQLLVTAGAGTTTWTVSRAQNGTTAAAHNKPAPIDQVSVPVASASAFPGTNGYSIEIGSEQMTVNSGAGTTTWLVSRGVTSAATSHASGAVVVQLANPVAGHYFCEQMASTLAGTSWNATALFPATQLGLVMTGVAITNGGAANSLTNGDTIAVTFNQPQSTIANVGANTALVCESWDGATPSNLTVFIYHSAYGAGGTPACSASTVYDVELTGLTITHAAAGTATINSQIAVSGNTATWTLKANGKALTAQTTITATPGSAVISTNGGNDISPLCTTASPAGLCVQTATGTKF